MQCKWVFTKSSRGIEFPFPIYTHYSRWETRVASRNGRGVKGCSSHKVKGGENTAFWRVLQWTPTIRHKLSISTLWRWVKRSPVMSGPGHLPSQTYGGMGTQGSDMCVNHCFFLCLLALWVRAALSNGPAAFKNNVAKCRRTHSLVFGALRGSEVTCVWEDLRTDWLIAITVG